MDITDIKFFVDGQLVRENYDDYVSTLNTGQKITMNIWQPIWESWVGAFDASICLYMHIMIG